MGKHYREGSERIGDPINDHSHAAIVRQLLPFYLMLNRGWLCGRGVKDYGEISA